MKTRHRYSDATSMSGTTAGLGWQEEDCRGVIYLENRTMAGVFNEEDLQRAEQLARSVSRRLGTYLAAKALLG